MSRSVIEFEGGLNTKLDGKVNLSFDDGACEVS